MRRTVSKRLYTSEHPRSHPIALTSLPFSAGAWESQMVYLASRGYRCVVHDRRGHGRSSQPWDGNSMDTCADDLSEFIDKLGLNGTTLVGHSASSGEVARYIGRTAPAASPRPCWWPR